MTIKKHLPVMRKIHL